MSLDYKIEIQHDKYDGGYVVNCPELPGCVTCAQTAEEGLKQIYDAKKAWLSACIEDGIEIPEPISGNDYSGQFKLRLPKSLHKSLAENSKKEGISMNQYCIYLLSKNDSNDVMQNRK